MNALTVVELKKLAKSKGIKGYSKLRKSELLSALNRSPSRSVKRSRSRSGKRRSVKRSRSRSGKRRSVKRSRSRSGKRRSVKNAEHTISIKPYFVPDEDDNYVPSDDKIGKFIQEHAVEAIKEFIEIHDSETENMGVKFLSYNPKTRTMIFKVPGKYRRKQVEEFIDGIRYDSFSDSLYQSDPGTGVVLRRGGVIDYRDAIKLM